MLIQYRMISPMTNRKLRCVLLGVTREAGSLSGWQPVNQLTGAYVHQQISIRLFPNRSYHYSEVIMGTMASQITSLTVVYSTVHSGADQRQHQSSPALAFGGEFTGDRWIPRTNGPVTRKICPFDDVIMRDLLMFLDSFWLISLCMCLVTAFKVRPKTVTYHTFIWA